MIIPTATGYFAPDLPTPVEEWMPKRPEDVFYLLEISIGGDTGSDIFQVMIATPESLRATKAQKLKKTKTLCIDKYSWENVKSEIGKILEHCRAETWMKCAENLSKHFNCEFED